MKIAILNGSPRENGNTSALCKAFADGVKENGHFVQILNIGKMNIAGCKDCKYCKGENKGVCVQNDDMQKVYPLLAEADMVVFASPVYYWGFTGQMQSAITRFYPFPKLSAKKYALILSSGSENVVNGIIYQYTSMVNYFGGENLGVKKFFGGDQKSAKNLEEMKEFGKNIK
ncbi:MAG: flavodoxin family protein [Anaerofustis stercorihominis]|nr:flavodoxin family protein [Anaerofustis stercorihominis]